MHRAFIRIEWCHRLRHAGKELVIGSAGDTRSLRLFLLCLCARLVRLARGLSGRMQAFEVGQARLIAAHSPATVVRRARPCSQYLRW
jgi:hypothetical protein